jgi:hypothetical protein
MAAIVNLPGLYPAGSTPLYTAQIVDSTGSGIPGSSLDTLTLSIVDTQTGTIINDCSQVDILNTNRGTVDGAGNLTITLEIDDTETSEASNLPQVQRSLVIDWTYNTGVSAGRHQANFQIVNLAGA